ncbi:MAG: hypothetical protein KDJ63_08465 [Nitratireductor sp.]|nr:hypothetical protein [Nitratireductor sp.]
MKKSKFSEAQIAFILRQADEGTPVTGLAPRPAGGRWFALRPVAEAWSQATVSRLQTETISRSFA